MNKDKFEQWGAGHSHLPNLVSAAKVIEERLGNLGFDYANLEEAYQNDGFDDIFGRLDDLRIEFQKGNDAALDNFLPNSPSEKKLFQLASYKSRFQKYKDFMDGKPSPIAGLPNAIDMTNLKRLKQRFLQQHPDFITFADCPSFAESEGDYKRALVAEAGRLVAAQSIESDEALGGALIDLLAGRTKLPCNLIDWRAQKVFDNLKDAHPGLLEAATGRLARAADTQAGIMQFVETVWPVMRGDLPSNPYAESRMYPTMLRALVDPQSVLPIRSTPTDNASRMLLSKPAFANAPLVADELRITTDMAREMMLIMDEEWGWGPRDLWDVQGFIWETCQKSLRDEGMTDEELLHLFDSCDYFRTRRKKWTDDQTASFCRMARKVHDLGLDWYRTGIPQIRFGRREKDASRASATLASFDAAPGRIRFSHSARELGLTGMRFDCGPEGEHAFFKLLDQRADEIEGWMPPIPKREGFWPTYDEGDVVEEVSEEDVRNDAEPTNLILFGPPGTGKTFKTMEVAVKLCGEVPAKVRKGLRTQYERLRKDKRIEFVTFHQNFAYEEFVEGLRPPHSSDQDEDQRRPDGGLILDVHPGIFRDIADNALLERGPSALTLDPQRSVFKIALGDRGSEEAAIQDALDGGIITLGWGGSIDWSDAKYEEFSAILFKWQSEMNPDATGKDSNVDQLFALRSWMQEDDYVVVSDGRDRFRAIGEVIGPYEFHEEIERHPHRRKVRWLWRNDEGEDRATFYPRGFRRHSLYRLDPKVIDWAALSAVANNDGDAPTTTGRLPYVLIIDEINRANISKVFGELITLIEPDKRLGMSNALKVRLPYSKREFGVPANLHIIGTMNTADRSVMQIDTALRRRFRFEEMEPDSSKLEMVAGINLGRVLDTINARIEYLLDRDHAVGHAFFMGEGGKDRAAIDDTMRFKIIPLLQEYFFDDWRNIAAVLGKGFVSGKTLAVPPGIEDRGERTRWTIRWQEDDSQGNRKFKGFPDDAYDLLLKGTEAEVEPPEATDEVIADGEA